MMSSLTWGNLQILSHACYQRAIWPLLHLWVASDLKRAQILEYEGFLNPTVCVPWVLSHCSRVWLLVTPWTAARHAPLSMEFPREEYWSGLPFPTPGDLPNPGNLCCSLRLLHWQVGSLPLAPPGKPKQGRGWPGRTQTLSQSWLDPLFEFIALLSLCGYIFTFPLFRLRFHSHCLWARKGNSNRSVNS